MNSLNPLGTRPYQNLTPATSQDAKQTRTAPVKNADAGSAVSLSSQGIDMQKRVADLGNSTVDLAQNLLGSFAQNLFGDQAKGATISFDSVTLESSSTLAAGVMHSEDANGVTDAAAMSLTDSSHFLGKGTITTADGRKFDFEVEIKYQASAQAGAAATSVPSRRAEMADQNPAMPLPTVEFPDIDFPGSLADLFKLMEHNHDVSIQQKKDSGDGADELGKLSMRLLKLVNSDSKLDTYAPANKAKEVANAYGATAQKADAPAAAPAPAPTPAPAPADATPAPAPAQAAAPAPAAEAAPAATPAAGQAQPPSA
ncbi:hypothetical protein AB4Z19_01695 [Pseudoduganella sp. RAF19]|uniref:hypothetical protein n=2 Tax=unclassified Pseudoduganella TaxID=2637179 RepID=UPI003F9C1458